MSNVSADTSHEHAHMKHKTLFRRNGPKKGSVWERTACRLFRDAAKAVLDQSRRRIKTSSPHFTSISPTFPELCAAAEVNEGRLFFDLLYLCLSPSFLPLPLCLPFELKLARAAPCRSVSAFALPSQLAYSTHGRCWEYGERACWCRVHLYSRETREERRGLPLSESASLALMLNIQLVTTYTVSLQKCRC